MSLSLGTLRQPSIGLPATGWDSSDPNALFGVLMPMFDDIIKTAFESDNKAFETFMKRKVIDWFDTAYEFYVDIRRNPGAFAAVEDGAIMDGDRPETVRGRVLEKYIGNSISLTDSLVAARNARKSLVNLVTYLLKGMVRDTMDMLSRLVYLSGNGVVATIVTANSGNPSTLNSIQRLVVNQQLEVWDAARTAFRGYVYVVNLGGGTAAQVTLSTSRQGTAGLPTDTIATDVLCFRGSQDGLGTSGVNRMFTGLDAHVDDGDVVAIHQNIRRSGAGGGQQNIPEWRAYRNSNGGVARNLTAILMHTLIHAVHARGGRQPEALKAHPFLGITYSELIRPLVQYSPGGKASFGNDSYGITTGGKTYTIDFDINCPYDKLYALTPSDFAYLEKIPFGWRGLSLDQSLTPQRGSAFAAAQNQFRYQGVWYGVGESVMFRATSQGLLEDLSIDIPHHGRF